VYDEVVQVVGEVGTGVGVSQCSFGKRLHLIITVDRLKFYYSIAIFRFELLNFNKGL